MNNKKNIYICGPISGHDIEERRAAFAAVERMLREEGLEVVNPLTWPFPEDCTHEQYMRVDIALLIGCDYIYLMKGWYGSRGAVTEFLVACSAGIEVYANESFLSFKEGEHVESFGVKMNINMSFIPGTHFDQIKDKIRRLYGQAK